MAHRLSSALPSSPGNGFSLRKRSLQPAVPSGSRRCSALRRPAADTGLLLLRAPADPLPCGVHGHVPAPVACSPLELRPAGLPRRRVLSQEAAGSRLLPTAGKRPGTGQSNFQPRCRCSCWACSSWGTRSCFMGPQRRESPQCLLRWIRGSCCALSSLPCLVLFV